MPEMTRLSFQTLDKSFHSDLSLLLDYEHETHSLQSLRRFALDSIDLFLAVQDLVLIELRQQLGKVHSLTDNSEVVL